MKKIKLTQGQFTIVDEVNYDWLNQWKWYVRKNRKNFYAARAHRENGKHFTIRMSRQILGLEQGNPQQADHKNHRTLDNRICNLRVCTQQENVRNREVNSKTISQFKGVSRDSRGKKWRARISYCGNRISLGEFSVEEQAALAYNKAAIEYHGEFACLNPI